MFKPAVTLRREAGHEQVVITGRAICPKQGTDGTAKARKVLLPGGHRGRLKQTLPNPVMRHTSHTEVQLSQVTESQGSIDQLVVIRSTPTAINPRQCSSHLPAFRQLDAELMGLPATAFHPKSPGGRCEKAALAIKPVGAHAALNAKNGVMHLNGFTAADSSDPPAVAITTFGLQQPLTTVRPEALEVAHVITLEIGARRPTGQAQQKLVS